MSNVNTNMSDEQLIDLWRIVFMQQYYTHTGSFPVVMKGSTPRKDLTLSKVITKGDPYFFWYPCGHRFDQDYWERFDQDTVQDRKVILNLSTLYDLSEVLGIEFCPKDVPNAYILGIEILQ